MNPDTGRMHRDNIAEQLKKVYQKQPQETVEHVLERAKQKIEKLESGPALPPEWPRFIVGETFHLKGHKFRIREILSDGIVLELAPKSK